MKHLKNAIDEKAKSIGDIPKNGRTHLMDTIPVTFSGNECMVCSNSGCHRTI